MSPSFEPVDFHAFHRETLPGRLEAGHGALAARGARELGPLAFRLREGGAYTYLPGEDGIEIAPGDDAADTVVEIGSQAWQGLVHDLESAPGLLYAGLVRGLRGEMLDFVRWEPALRAMYLGRPVYDPAAVDLLDRHGRRLDPVRSFRLEDTDEEMADFLDATGYLLVRGAFAPEEVETFRVAAERLAERAVEGDRESWWGRRADGRSVLCRVIHAGVAPELAALYGDPRVTRLAALSTQKLVAADPEEVNGVAVVWKQPGISEGLGDLPWHRDCGLGGHAVKCPCMVCSIYLRPANAGTGDLRFLPGSWRSSVGFAQGDDESAPRGISIAAEAGDVSFHYGDVAHAAPPPESSQGPHRTSVLLSFRPEGARHHRGEAHYNDVIFQGEEGEAPNMVQVAARR
jgi:ectoine hydroxylase-related dioxygenase (phytanoyl-CoA dioxygenase family)